MKLVDGLNQCTNAEYHADKEYLSSSSYKLLLTDLPRFYKEKILGEKIEEGDKPYFVEGSYVHSLILEPEMIEKEYAVYPGPRRQGKEWEAFKAANPGKQCITERQVQNCEKYYAQWLQLATKVNPIGGGISELTICGTFSGIKTKVRFDYINVDKGYIIDVKTSGKPVDRDSFKNTVDLYMYDLSAALYLDLAEKHYGKRFEFYFLCIGKSTVDCQLFRLSEDSRLNGQLNLAQAVKIFRKCSLSNKWDDNIIEDYEILDV